MPNLPPKDPAFETAGKKSGLQVWRVESWKLKLVPVTMHGSFYSGDSYIVLKTTQVKSGNFSWDIHFWLGNASSQDERGTAAILTTQMDDYLGGGPVQYRHEQGYESSEFMSLFKNQVKYLKGGVASGFKKVEVNVKDVKRLLHIKGRRAVRSTEVEMNWSSFNSGDVFILDVGNDIVVWKGKQANVKEGFKAASIANSIKNDEKAGKGVVTRVDEGDAYPKLMTENLGGNPSDIKGEIPDDEVVAAKSNKPATLHHVSSDTGKLVVKEIKTAPFSQSDLDSGDCYIVDNGSNGKIYVWKGKTASKDERTGALANAENFISQKKYPSHVSIEIIPQGSESVLFREFFPNWKMKDEVVGFGKVYTENRIAKVKQMKIDLKSLSTNPKLAAKHRMVDDGSGKLEIWRVEDELVEVPKSQFGVFYSGDCYVMLYTYLGRGKKKYIIYYWQGSFATADEITASAFHAVLLDNKYNGDPVQVRVIQGKEPAHLIACLGRPMVILLGGRSAKSNDVNFDRNATNLFQVYCTDAGGSKASQAEAVTKSLNSNDTFLLSTKDKCYIWKGKGTTDEETDAADATKDLLKLPSATEVNEGNEPADFWSLLGGKGPYSNHPRLHAADDSHPARLFGISNASGAICVDEVAGEFHQSDLEPDDVMMLDVWEDVFVWIGSDANRTEKKEAMKIAERYIKEDPRGRDSGTAVTLIKQGNEPGSFTGFFPSWDENYKYHLK